MRVAYFDAVGGAAGDMILGALLDAGLDLDRLRAELERLHLDGVEVRVDRVMKREVSATQFEVSVGGVDEHAHHHHHQQPAAGRSLREILALVSASAISERAKELSRRVFQLLGDAEAKIHGVEPGDVHFHEIGAMDSIVDIVGSAVAIDVLGLDEVFSSPLPIGSGLVRTRHGLFPVPAPATLEIMAKARIPTRPSRVQMEQVTPTGAAILAAVATFEQPSMTIERVGYGAGHADLEVPNVLRVWLGETDDSRQERIIVMQTNVDDMNPEISAHVLDRCLQEGALDALLTPAVMKKGRPGLQFEVLCRPNDLPKLRALLVTETTTLGVRWWEVDRLALPRAQRTVQTRYGPVSVKIRHGGDGVTSAAPEYEDCRRVAHEAGVPLLAVYRAAIAAAEADPA